MEALIEKNILKHADEREKREVARIKYQEDTPIREYQEKYIRKCVVYNELSKIISQGNVADKIGKAKFEDKNYAIIVNKCFNRFFTNGEIKNKKKLIYNFNPYGQGTIYHKLSELLPKGYKIHVYEPWSVHLHQCVVYVSWGELSALDEFNLWL